MDQLRVFADFIFVFGEDADVDGVVGLDAGVGFFEGCGDGLLGNAAGGEDFEGEARLGCLADHLKHAVGIALKVDVAGHLGEVAVEERTPLVVGAGAVVDAAGVEVDVPALLFAELDDFRLMGADADHDAEVAHFSAPVALGGHVALLEGEVDLFAAALHGEGLVEFDELCGIVVGCDLHDEVHFAAFGDKAQPVVAGAGDVDEVEGVDAEAGGAVEDFNDALLGVPLADRGGEVVVVVDEAIERVDAEHEAADLGAAEFHFRDLAGGFPGGRRDLGGWRVRVSCLKFVVSHQTDGEGCAGLKELAACLRHGSPPQGWSVGKAPIVGRGSDRCCDLAHARNAKRVWRSALPILRGRSAARLTGYGGRGEHGEKVMVWHE